MFDDYIHVFKQFTLYRHYLQGGPPSHGPNRNELLLRNAQGSNDPGRLVVDVVNYTSKSSFTNHISHFKEYEVFMYANELLIVLLMYKMFPSS